jgi:hypothetical protein
MTVIGQDENTLKELEARQKLIPYVPSATSYRMGWKTLHAVRYRNSPASGEFSLPPVSRNGLVLTIRPADKFEACYDGMRINRPPVTVTGTSAGISRLLCGKHRIPAVGYSPMQELYCHRPVDRIRTDFMDRAVIGNVAVFQHLAKLPKKEFRLP